MTRFIRAVAVLSVCFLTTISLSGCSKKKEEAGVSAAAVESELLERLPVTTIGYVFSDSSTPAYGAFKSSQWYQSPDTYLSSVGEVTADAPAAKAVLDVVKTSSLFTLDAQGNEPIVQSVFFAAKPNGAGAPEIGVFAKTRNPLDVAKFLATVENALKAEGIPNAREKVAGVDVLTADLQVDVAGATPQESKKITLKAFFIALPDRVGVVSSAGLAERLVKTLDQIAPNDRGIGALKAQPGYQRAVARAAGVGGQFIFGFADVAAITDLVKSNAPAGTPGISDGTIDDLPFEALSFCRAMSDGLNDHLWLGVKEGGLTPEVKADLAKAGHHPGLKNAPLNPVGVLSIDGSLLRSVKDSALKGLSPEERANAESMSAPVDAVKGLSIVVRNAAGASPFPELTIMIETDDAVALQGNLKTLLSALTAGGGLPVSGWQTKDIGGAKVDFLVSPIGVGLFMGAVKNTLVLSTADGSITDLVGGKSAPEVAQALSAGALKNISAPLLLFYTSGGRIAAFLESLEATMGMFTGGKPLVDAETQKTIRAMGTIGTAVGFSDDAVQVHTSYLPEKEAK